MNKKTILLLCLCVLSVIVVFVVVQKQADSRETDVVFEKEDQVGEKEILEEPNPLSIQTLRAGEYPGSEFVVKQTLENGTNYERYVVSYLSEGLEINGLLTVPTVPVPEGGFPAVVFVHGYIPPTVYSTINSYPTYQARLARSGVVTFKTDLRGHDESEGEPVSAHYSEKYVIDTLNAIAAMRQDGRINPDRIGYWGHSNGGEIGLRTILIDQDIKAASLWAGVVGSYEDMFETYIDEIPFLNIEENPLVAAHGLPSSGAAFWRAVDPFYYLDEVRVPVQLIHGTLDDSVPVELSRSLRDALQAAGKDVSYIEYVDDHNVSAYAATAWGETISFFNEHLF